MAGLIWDPKGRGMIDPDHPDIIFPVGRPSPGEIHRFFPPKPADPGSEKEPIFWVHGGPPSQYHITQEQRRAEQVQIASNTTRAARCAVKLESRATGSGVLNKEVSFGMAFTSEPSVTTGLALAPGQQIKRDVYPIASIGVYQWRQDKQGFFTGAHVYGAVQLIQPTRALVKPPTPEELKRLHDDKKIKEEDMLYWVGQARGSTGHAQATAEYLNAKRALEQAQAYATQKANINAVIKAGGYVLHHHLVFEGEAMKTVPHGLIDMLGSGQSVASGGRA